MLRIISIIVFSVFLLTATGCFTFNSTPVRDWPEPSKPVKYEVNFKVVNFPTNGLFINEQDSKNLLKNMNELDGYIAKLEAMIKEMKEYYKAK